MDAPVELALSGGKQIKEDASICLAQKDVSAFDAAVVHMPESTGMLEAKRSGQRLAAKENEGGQETVELEG